MSTYLLIYLILSIYVTINISIYLSICLSIYSSIFHLSYIYLTFYLSLSLSPQHFVVPCILISSHFDPLISSARGDQTFHAHTFTFFAKLDYFYHLNKLLLTLLFAYVLSQYWSYRLRITTVACKILAQSC